MIRLQLFGSPQMTLDGVAVPLTTRKAWSIVGYLAARGGRPVGRSRLAGEIWGELDEARARAALATTLWRLKAALQQAGAPQVVGTTGDQLMLEAGPEVASDIAEFKRLAVQPSLSRDALAPEAVDLLEQATALHAGDFAEGIDEAWCLIERESLRAAVVGMLDRLVSHYAEAGEHRDVVRVGSRLLAEEPYVEHVHRAIIAALGKLGERALAARQFTECARLLRDELGLEPTDETVAVYLQILGEGMREAALPPETIDRARGGDRDARLAHALSCLREAEMTLDGLRRRS
jgi:DNA-binding SARP family transcriptional activator